MPVVGNFGGPKALRAVGKYVREHGATVTAFYLSNVEQYLQQDGIWGAFCANVASMPLDDVRAPSSARRRAAAAAAAAAHELARRDAGRDARAAVRGRPGAADRRDLTP